MAVQTAPRRPAIELETTSRREWNLWAASGPLFVALFGVGFLVANVLASPPWPSAFASSATVERFVVANSDEIRTLSFLYSAAALALLAFVAAVAALLRRAADRSVLPWLALGGGILAATFLLLSALLDWMLARSETAAEPVLLLALADLTYLTGGPGHVLALATFLAAASVVAMQVHVLPRWIAWAGIAAAVPSALAATALLWEPGAFFLPLGRALTYLWILAVSAVLARTAR
jgi:hypothetical protein